MYILYAIYIICMFKNICICTKSFLVSGTSKRKSISNPVFESLFSNLCLKNLIYAFKSTKVLFYRFER